MAKEYVYENTDEGYKIDWDKVEINVQESKRDMNNANAEYAIDHEIYCDYYGEQIGYMHFSEFKNVNAKNVHQSLLDKEYEKLIYINNILVNSEFRGWGIGSKLYDKFGELYKQNFMDWPIAQVFINPVAEYSFKRAIDRGSIPESAFIDELTTRDYNETEKQKAKELFNWLPKEEQEDFKDKMEKQKELNANILDRRAFSWLKNLRMEKTSAVDLLDARQINVEHSTEPTSQKDLDSIDAKTYITHFIELFAGDGSLVGFIQFFEVENVPADILDLESKVDGIIEKAIYIQLVEVAEQFQNSGFAYKIYEEFGNFYSSNFSGWPVGRNFINPVAEYSFRKAVEKGLVPEETLAEDLLKRSYDTEEKKNQAKDLRNKLPEHVRGPETWAVKKDFRLVKKANSLLLYHGTYYDVAKKILEEGAIKPSVETGVTNPASYTLQPDCVYLSTTSSSTILYGGEGREGEGDTIIFELSLDDSDQNFVADEDAMLLDEDAVVSNLEEIFEERGLDVSLIARDFDTYRPDEFFKNPEYSFAFDELMKSWSADDSLEESGTVAHRGQISLDNVVSMINGTTNKKTNNISLEGLNEIHSEMIEMTANRMSDMRIKKLAYSEEIDLRSIEVAVNVTHLSVIDEEIDRYVLNALSNGIDLGSLKFDYNNDGDIEFLEIDFIEVQPEFRGLGISGILYKKFGEIYQQNYMDLPVRRDFINSLAEYSFLKAIEKGWVPESAYSEEDIIREYDKEELDKYKK